MIQLERQIWNSKIVSIKILEEKKIISNFQKRERERERERKRERERDRSKKNKTKKKSKTLIYSKSTPIEMTHCEDHFQCYRLY